MSRQRIRYQKRPNANTTDCGQLFHVILQSHDSDYDETCIRSRIKRMEKCDKRVRNVVRDMKGELVLGYCRNQQQVKYLRVRTHWSNDVSSTV
jgi:hypothetical protein